MSPRPGPSGPPHRPHHHVGHGPEWLVRVDDHVSRAEFVTHVGAIAEALKSTGTIQINGTTLTVPDEVDLVLCYERTPHGSLALVIRAEWFNNPADSGMTVSSAGLTISPSSAAA
jgi:hypothetical protein